MSSRPASPPPISRWPFFSGAFALAAFAVYLLLTAGRPPEVPPLIAAMFCLGGSTVLCVIPFLVENERRLRLAEATVRDAADAQLRRLAQTADQLAHVVSRGQSTEEQAGRALGTLEEVAERMVAQAEELATALTRAAEREQAAQSEEIQRLVEERDQKFTALEIRLNATSVALTETQAAIKKSSAATSRAIETLAVRLEEVADELREAVAARPPLPAAPTPAAPEPEIDAPPVRTRPAPADPEAAPAPADPEAAPVAEVVTEEPVAPPVEPAAAPVEAPVAEPAAEPAADVASPFVVADAGIEPPGVDSVSVSDPAVDAPAPVEDEHPAPRAPRKPRHPRVADKPVESPSADEAPVSVEVAAADEPPPAQPTAPLELALEGMPEPRPVMRLNRREPPGSTSLVATAYIGIGNKLFLRGDGPGLSWERGVPMQFLAIGKWGWTTTEAATPVTCRVYRNDDTPMLEENIVIDPGTKSEITPKF